MTLSEQKILDLLRRGRNEYGFLSVRAEFETEGASFDDVKRLLDLGSKANLNLVLKIGGCEAIRDLKEGKSLGASSIITPMIESSYALEKYDRAVDRIYSLEERKTVEFYFNIETKQAYEIHEELVCKAKNKLNGIVFGRVDFVCSQGISRDLIDHLETTKKVIEVATACLKNNLDFIVGGGISAQSIQNLNNIARHHLTRFETRKISFDPSVLSNKNIHAGLECATFFEFLWLKNKQTYQSNSSLNDFQRIKMLENRLKQLAS